MTDQTQNANSDQQLQQDAAGSASGSGQQQGQQSGGSGGQSGDVQFDADSSIEQGGEVEFTPSGQQSQSPDSSGGQQQQFSAPSGQQGGSSGSDNRFASQIREHMEVIGADGAHLGTVDHVDGDRIKLTKSDSGMGSHQGHHHYLPLGLVADIEGNKVRLSATGANAYGMESES